MKSFTRRRRGCFPGILSLCWIAFGAHAGFVFTTLLSFDGTNGANPMAALAQGVDGNLYGTTTFGGISSAGTVFGLTTNGVLTNLFSFRGTNGLNPQAGLTVFTNGDFYGTTYGGGAGNVGTVFKITTNGAFNLLWSFAGNDGANPDAVLTADTSGNFYGTTALGGGKTGHGGTVFGMTATGALTNLFSFDTNNGALPQAELVRGPDGDFYGTTYSGGASNLGTIFKMTTNGALSTIYSFTNTDGVNPDAGLLLASDGNFYGTTYFGGAHGKGTVFQLTTNGMLNVLISFHGTNGANPQGRLVQGEDGNLYGATVNGGTNGFGTVFQITTNGSLATLHNFGGFPDGAQPEAGLLLAGDGNFYGTAAFGGTNSLGTVFCVGLAPPPVLESITETNGNVTLAWTAVAGQTYKLQFRTNLEETIWHNLDTNTATGSLITDTDASGLHKQRYYRVVLLP